MGAPVAGTARGPTCTIHDPEGIAMSTAALPTDRIRQWLDERERQLQALVAGGQPRESAGPEVTDLKDGAADEAEAEVDDAELALHLAVQRLRRSHRTGPPARAAHGHPLHRLPGGRRAARALSAVAHQAATATTVPTATEAA
jgi:hypothetical protein